MVYSPTTTRPIAASRKDAHPPPHSLTFTTKLSFTTSAHGANAPPRLPGSPRVFNGKYLFGKLTRRRSAYQAQTNSKLHIFGDLEFADDTATTTESEFPTADRLLEQTFTDWGEKLNRAKTETLLLKPGTPPDKQRDPPQAHQFVRHVGGLLSDTGAQWKDTLHRCMQARRRAKDLAKAWATGSHRG